jgi:CDP-diacylglycerol--glycerol-3-phosphate 3-phosphatidyltransferase
MLLFVMPFSLVFNILYFICGMSDILDGFIARKMDASSKLGQILDSIADFIFICVVFYSCLPVIVFPLWIIAWIAFVAAIRMVSIVIGVVKYHQLAFLHTYANKLTGIVLFLFPLLFWAVGKEITAIAICEVASVSAMEELLINLKSKTLNRDIKSILCK